MEPSAPAADREYLRGLGRGPWGAARGDRGGGGRLSRIVVASRTQALLIESPEPLDFVQEITSALTRRTRTGPFPPRRPDLDGPVVVERGAAAAPPEAAHPRESLRERLEAVSPPAAGRPAPARPARDRRDDPRRRGPAPGHAARAAPCAGKRWRKLSVIAVGADGAPQLYRGPVRPGTLRGAPAIMTAALIRSLPVLPHGSELAQPLAGAPPGTVLLATNDLRELLGRHRLQAAEVDVPVPVLIVQSGDGRCALVVPASGASFETGLHRLTLTLSRRRWDTTDPADDLNTCTGGNADASPEPRRSPSRKGERPGDPPPRNPKRTLLGLSTSPPEARRSSSVGSCGPDAKGDRRMPRHRGNRLGA